MMFLDKNEFCIVVAHLKSLFYNPEIDFYIYLYVNIYIKI